MRRDEYEENLRRMEYEYRQHLKEVQEALSKLRNRYEDGLNNAGLEMDRKGIVRYADNASKASVAPTYQAEMLVQARSYEVETRMADINKIAQDGIQAVIDAYSKIEANQPMPKTLENQLREIQEKVKEATNFVIGQHAGYTNNGYHH